MKRELFFSPLESHLMIHHVMGEYYTSRYHQHDGYELYLFLNGSANYYVEQNCYQLKRGSLLMICPGELHRVECFDTVVYERLIINFSTEVITSLSTPKSDLKHCFNNKEFGKDSMTFLSEEEITEFVVLAHTIEQYNRSESYGSDIMVNADLSRLLLKVNSLFEKCPAQKPINCMPPLIAAVMNYTNKYISEGLTVTELSDAMHHNGVYLNRIFKQTTGVSLQQYLIGLKVRLAQHYIKEERPLSEVCSLSGFHDYSNFARTFKKQTGISPHKYKTQLTQHM